MFYLLCTEYVCVYQVAVQCSIYFVPNMFVFIRSLCNVLFTLYRICLCLSGRCAMYNLLCTLFIRSLCKFTLYRICVYQVAVQCSIYFVPNMFVFIRSLCNVLFTLYRICLCLSGRCAMFYLLCTEYVCVYQVAVQCSIYFVPNMFVFIRSLCNVQFTLYRICLCLSGRCAMFDLLCTEYVCVYQVLCNVDLLGTKNVCVYQVAVQCSIYFVPNMFVFIRSLCNVLFTLYRICLCLSGRCAMFYLLCTEYVCVYQVAVQCSIYFVPNMFVFIRSLCNVLFTLYRICLCLSGRCAMFYLLCTEYVCVYQVTVQCSIYFVPNMFVFIRSLCNVLFTLYRICLCLSGRCAMFYLLCTEYVCVYQVAVQCSIYFVLNMFVFIRSLCNVQFTWNQKCLCLSGRCVMFDLLCTEYVCVYKVAVQCTIYLVPNMFVFIRSLCNVRFTLYRICLCLSGRCVMFDLLCTEYVCVYQVAVQCSNIYFVLCEYVCVYQVAVQCSIYFVLNMFVFIRSLCNVRFTLY